MQWKWRRSSSLCKNRVFFPLFLSFCVFSILSRWCRSWNSLRVPSIQDTGLRFLFSRTLSHDSDATTAAAQSPWMYPCLSCMKVSALSREFLCWGRRKSKESQGKIHVQGFLHVPCQSSRKYKYWKEVQDRMTDTNIDNRGNRKRTGRNKMQSIL